MKNNKRLTILMKTFRRVLNIYLTVPFGCEIAAIKVANNTARKRQMPSSSGDGCKLRMIGKRRTVS